MSKTENSQGITPISRLLDQISLHGYVEGKNLYFLGGYGSPLPLRNADFYPPHICEEIYLLP